MALPQEYALPSPANIRNHSLFGYTTESGETQNPHLISESDSSRNHNKISTSLFIHSMTLFQGHLLNQFLLLVPFAKRCLQPSQWVMMSDKFLESREIASLVDAD